ncbi:hypothetical protein BDV98DRAFT_360615 [Pterulicium gracile]|uniref:Uncharacterized protein n=1 Tax=Pterulicium gracile TaxID=1884261 RepID=A0A5C3QRA7_9AGAR|nr:hypothetical protein BDV98DRAFT_360615 [Pterula gracilis]
MPRRRSSRSSLLSIATTSSLSAQSPRTPSRSGASDPTSLFFASTCNRRSTDSWNSSIHETDDLEWKSDQSLFLLRTLDALPSHLITPYNGIPPANLLEKIARGVAQAKGPNEWPHSLRATRVKLMELARNRAKEECQSPMRLKSPRAQVAATIPEEEGGATVQATPGQKHRRAGSGEHNRRPLYRQSSMDFVKDVKETQQNIARLSRRLQHSDRVLDPPYHPYASGLHKGRTPPPPSSKPLNPSTASSSTLNSSYDSSCSSSGRPGRGMLRRSASTLLTSNLSDPSFTPPSSPPDLTCLGPQDGTPKDIKPTVVVTTLIGLGPPPRTRPRRSESYSAPRRAVKRAPSFGALAQENRKLLVAAMDVDGKGRESPASSDEEEKARNRRSKKLKVKLTPSAVPSTPSKDENSTVTKSRPSPSGDKRSSKSTSARKAPSPALEPLQSKQSENQSRPSGKPSAKSKSRKPTPLTFGGELPGISNSPPSKARAAEPVLSFGSPMYAEPTPSTSELWSAPYPNTSNFFNNQSPASPALSPPASPALQGKTLRRVRRLDLAQAQGRRISFNSLARCPEEEASPDADHNTLGSAVQLG